MNPPSFFHANSRTKSVLFCRQTWPPFHVVAKQVLTYVRCRVKNHTQQWIQLSEQVIVKVPYCEICKIFVFIYEHNYYPISSGSFKSLYHYYIIIKSR